MAITTLILPALAAIIVFLLYMVILRMASSEETIQERVRRLAGSLAPADENEKILAPLRQDNEVSAFAATLEQLLRITGIDTQSFRENTHLQFYRAGMHSPDAQIYYLFIKRIGFVFFLLIGFWIASNAGTGMHRIMFYLIAILICMGGVLGPDMLLRNERDKRELILQRSFPDALDLLLVCVESGLALDGALSRVCKELGRAHPVITQELNRTRLELTLLNDRVQALNNLAERTDMLAFRSLVTTLLQSERFGTSLTDTLRVLSEDFRNTRLMLAEEKAGRLPVLMTIPLITLLIPALFLIILGPAIISVLHVVANN